MYEVSEDLVCRRCGALDAGPLGSRCPADGRVRVPVDELAAHPDDPFLGRVLGGKYAVVGRLGAGTFGSVYRAVQEPIGRVVAVKVINTQLGGHPEIRARFFREAQVVARLSHPSVVVLHDYGEDPDGDVLYMALEYVAGQSLRELIRDEAPLAPERVVRLLGAVLGALAEAHRHGQVHRDLKPDNLMHVRGTFGEERLRVLDFGIAKVLGAGEDRDTWRTRSGIVLGTPAYLSPEQAVAAPVSPATDLYSLGVVAFEMLTGEVPFRGTTAFELLRAHLQAPVPEMSPTLGVPPALEAAVRRVLEKRPEDRFADARALADALRAAVVAEPRAGGDPFDDRLLETAEAPWTRADETVPEAPPAPAASASFEYDATPLLDSRDLPAHIQAAAQPQGAGPERALVDSRGDDAAPQVDPVAVAGSEAAASVSGIRSSVPASLGTEAASDEELAVMMRGITRPRRARWMAVALAAGAVAAGFAWARGGPDREHRPDERAPVRITVGAELRTGAGTGPEAPPPASAMADPAPAEREDLAPGIPIARRGAP